MLRVPASRINHNLPSGWALPRGWQAYAIFGLLPLWWLIGLSAIIWVLIAIPLLATLVIRGGLRTPRRFGIWLLLLLWMAASGLELESSGRAVAWAWRGSFYLAGTVLFLYLINMPERRLPVRSIVNALAFYWIVVVIGGWAGVLFPTVEFASPVQHLLPGSFLHNTYVYEHVHLQFAEIQHFLGFPVGRPETFFAYTNAWGSAFAMLTPFAICAMTQARSRAWKLTLRFSLAAALVPVMFSLNRGLWLSLGVGIIYATIRFGLRGDFRTAGKVMAVLLVIGAALAVSPLGDLAQGRFEHKTGDTGRLQRDQQAQQRILDSPTFGFGAPLPSSDPTQSSVGTESEIFLLVFSHGIPGLALWVLWFAYTLFRSARWRSPWAFWAHVTILVALIQVPYYDVTERLPIMLVAAAIAYRAMMTQPVPEREPAGDPAPAARRRPALVPV
jgi:polysaccharide biosynthesis protein PslJ